MNLDSMADIENFVKIVKKTYEKNVLITGAGGGIGVSICETLIKKYNLILVGRNIEKLEGLMKGEKFVLKRIV